MAELLEFFKDSPNVEIRSRYNDKGESELYALFIESGKEVVLATISERDTS